MYGVRICFHSSFHDFETFKTCESERLPGVSAPNIRDAETETAVNITLVEPYQNKSFLRGTPPLPLQEEIDRASQIGSMNQSVL